MKRNAKIGLFTKPSRLAMHRDRIKWNARYHKGDYPTAPAGIVREFSRLASGRTALDLAAGNGRNALFLAEQGFEVDAVDISEAGLEMAAPAHSGIRPICADLDVFDIREGNVHQTQMTRIRLLDADEEMGCSTKRSAEGTQGRNS